MDRLKLTPAHIDTMLEGLRQVAGAAGPGGQYLRYEQHAQRHPGGPHARAAGRDRHHL